MNRLIAYLGILASIILGGILGLFASVLAIGVFQALGVDFVLSDISIMTVIALGAFICGGLAVVHVRRYMSKQEDKRLSKYLASGPENAGEFIKSIIRQIRYRKKVRLDIQAELVAHFEDELRNCTTDQQKQERAEQLITDFGDVKLLAVLMRRAKKRCRPLWRTAVVRGFQIIGILILYLIVYCVYISLGEPTVSVNYIEKAMLIARPVANESQNAAPIYQKAIDAYKKPPYIERQNKRSVAEKVTLLDKINKKYWIDELSEAELSALKQWISDNSQAINLLKQASQKPHCWWDLQAEDNIVINVLMPEFGSIRKLCILLCWRAKLYAFNRDTELAFDDLLVCYRIGLHFKGPGSVVEQLVGIAVQSLSARTALIILNNQKVESDSLQEFQAALENLVAEDIFIMDFSLEKFLVLDFLQRCYTDNGSGSGHMIPAMVGDFLGMLESFDESAFEEDWLVYDYGSWLAMSLASANRRRMSREFERLYNITQQRAYKTPWQLRKEYVDVEIVISNWSRLKQIRYWPVMMFMPSLGRACETSYRNKADCHALITIIALLRYKQDSGDYPHSLNELKNAGYLKQLPMDPFSDKPLVYKKSDDSFILYSVGPNFTDDGGQVYRSDEGKVRLWANEGDTVFWPVQK